MNGGDVTRFIDLIREQSPAVMVEVDEPMMKGGSTWIDVRLQRRHIAIEHRDGQGFAFHSDDAAYGQRGVETYRSPELAARRTAQLLSARKSEQALTLKGLRELYDWSQAQLAAEIGIQQAAVSRFESRNEVKVGTLADAVEALGGKLEIRAHFPDADVPLTIAD